MKKITTGFVTQKFDGDGECVDQWLTVGDQVEWEDDDGEPMMDPPDFYHPFEMAAP